MPHIRRILTPFCRQSQLIPSLYTMYKPIMLRYVRIVANLNAISIENPKPSFSEMESIKCGSENVFVARHF